MDTTEALAVLRKKLAHITRDYRPEDQALDCVRNEIKRLAASNENLRGEAQVSEGMYGDKCGQVARLEDHLRNVLEIARCWMPDYATAEDKAELASAEKELSP